MLGGDTVPQDVAGSSEVIRVAKPQLPAELFTAPLKGKAFPAVNLRVAGGSSLVPHVSWQVLPLDFTP